MHANDQSNRTRTHAQDMIALCLLLLRFSRYARYCVGRYSSATHAPKGVIKGYRKPENQGGAEGRVQGGHEKSTPMRENIMLRDETGDGGTGDAEDRERACTTGGPRRAREGAHTHDGDKTRAGKAQLVGSRMAGGAWVRRGYGRGGTRV